MLKLSKIVLLILIVVIGLVLVSHVNTASATQDVFISSKFGTDLYMAALGENPQENVIVSPLSVQTALGLILMGTDGTTADQIVKGLSLKTGDRSSLALHFQEILGICSSGETLKIANKVYLTEGYQLNPQFSETAMKQFGSEAETINFAESEAATNHINSWVEDKTNGKIKDIISADTFDDDTRMILINAVHFQAAWQVGFYKEYTRKKAFWISENEAVQVDTMFGDVRVRFNVSQVLNARIILIPYKDTSWSMVILLPVSRSGLQEMESKLHSFDFGSLSPDMGVNATVQLFLPKFQIEASVDLKSVLQKMGLVDMFTADASFPSLINTKKSLKVDVAMHKAYISVDEDGTEAVAAAGSKPHRASIPFILNVDRPFLFAIMKANDVAFIGSVRRF